MESAVGCSQRPGRGAWLSTGASTKRVPCVPMLQRVSGSSIRQHKQQRRRPRRTLFNGLQSDGVRPGLRDHCSYAVIFLTDGPWAVDKMALSPGSDLQVPMWAGPAAAGVHW